MSDLYPPSDGDPPVVEDLEAQLKAILAGINGGDASKGVEGEVEGEGKVEGKGEGEGGEVESGSLEGDMKEKEQEEAIQLVVQQLKEQEELQKKQTEEERQENRSDEVEKEGDGEKEEEQAKGKENEVQLKAQDQQVQGQDEHQHESEGQQHEEEQQQQQQEHQQPADLPTDFNQLLLEQTLAEVQKALADNEFIQQKEGSIEETVSEVTGPSTEAVNESEVQVVSELAFDEVNKTVSVENPMKISESQPQDEQPQLEPPQKQSHAELEHHELDQNSLNDLIQNALSALTETDDAGNKEAELAKEISKVAQQIKEGVRSDGSMEGEGESESQPQSQPPPQTQPLDQPTNQTDSTTINDLQIPHDLVQQIAQQIQGLPDSQESHVIKETIDQNENNEGETDQAALAAAISNALASVSDMGITSDTIHSAATTTSTTTLPVEKPIPTESDVLRIQQELQRILADSAADSAADSNIASTSHGEFDSEHSLTAAAQAISQALQSESNDSELANQKALIEQISAALNEQGHVVEGDEEEEGNDSHSHLSHHDVPEIDDSTVRAISELLSNSDLESTLSSILSGEHEPKKSDLSIAETLALSRSNIQKSREMLANRIDPMLNRKGYLQAWGRGRDEERSIHPQLQQLQQQQQQLSQQPSQHPQQLLQFQQQLKPSSSIPRQSTESSDEPSDMLAALLLAKQMIGEESENELELNPDAMEAVQQALQALGKSLQEETDKSDIDPFRPGRKTKRKYRTNAILTAEDKARIRLENRERKKKWRDNNAVRNKDNELRSRLHRRANGIFGTQQTPEKAAWLEKEFQKRKQKRMLREMQLDSGIQADQQVNNGTDNLRAALEILGKTEGISEGLAQTVDSLVKDPQLLKTLMGDLFNEDENDNNSNYTFQPQQTNIIKPIVGGGVMSAFKIKKPGTARKSIIKPTSQPQFPSKYPDRGLTSLVRKTMKPRRSKMIREERTTTPTASSSTIPTTTPTPSSTPAIPTIDLTSESLKRPFSLMSPKPPQYFTSPSIKKFRPNPITSTNSIDNKVKALGFPPLLSSLKR